MNMFSTKPTASLSSGLLARKGQARPAMRPQGFVGMTHETLEDLGWNDMGDNAPIDQVSTQLTTEPRNAEVPQVLRQRERLDQKFTIPVEQEAELETPHEEVVREPEPVVEAPQAAPEPASETRPVSINTANRIRRETRRKRGKSAAFTLRLDEDRHLRLRLASALSSRSAQMLVTEALDAFLDTMPQVDGLVRQVDGGRNR